MYHALHILISRLLFLVCLCSSVMAASPLKSVAVHRILFELKNEPAYGKLLVIKTRAMVNGFSGKKISTETTIGRTDGAPLASTGNLPAGWKRTEKGLEYAWSGKNEHLRTKWDLRTVIPLNAISPVSSVPFGLVIRYTVRSGGMSSYLDAEVTYPLRSIEPVRELRFNNITSKAVTSEHQQPNVAGRDVDNPNFTVRDHAEQLVFKFSAMGMKDDAAYVGAVFRDLNGSPIQPSKSCPKSNHGKKGNVQFQEGDRILHDRATWNNFRLKIPVQWLAIDTTRDQRLIATCYMSGGGLWAVHDREIVIHGSSQTGNQKIIPVNVDITRYTRTLREILAEIQKAKRMLEKLRSVADPAPRAVHEQGTALFRAGQRYSNLFGDGGEDTITRFGTFEEVKIVRNIRATHEKAALIFKELARVKLPAEANASSKRARNRSILEKVGRELIAEKAIRYIKRKGLADLLADKGQVIAGQKVQKRLELDLKGFMDRKSIELMGMPMGGFRSMKAAFRMQARNQIKATVSKIVLNFTGNQIVVLLLQKTILKWVDKELWPFLREAFRPKTKLARRVNISSNTMMAMCDELNQLAGGQDPRTVPLTTISDALDRAHGKIHAARYLKKDLKRSGNQDLKDTMAAAEKILNRTIRRVSHQFLLLDEGRWYEFVDNFQYTLGINEEVGRLLRLMNISQCGFRIWRPDADNLAKGKYHDRGTCDLPVFEMAVTGISADTPAGIKHLSVDINNRKYLLFAMYNQGEKPLQFKGVLPMFPGRNTVVFSSSDIPGFPETTMQYDFSPYEAEKIIKQLNVNLRELPGEERSMREASAYHRPDYAHDVIRTLLGISRYYCRLGKFTRVPQLIAKSLGLMTRSQLGPKVYSDVIDAYYQRAWIALAADNRNEYLRNKDAEMQTWLKYAPYLKAQKRFGALEKGWVYRAGFETAEMLLILGVDPNTIRPYVNTGVRYLKLYSPKKNKEELEKAIKKDYANVAAVFLGK